MLKSCRIFCIIKVCGHTLKQSVFSTPSSYFKKYFHVRVAFNEVHPRLPFLNMGYSPCERSALWVLFISQISYHNITPLPLKHVLFFCRKKFSVRHFWEDCRRYNCNGAQYIGEICRYILSAPETPDEKLHKVDIMIGNGLRPPIWDQVCL